MPLKLSFLLAALLLARAIIGYEQLFTANQGMVPQDQPPAHDPTIALPRGMAVTDSGDIYFAAQGENRVLEITSSGHLLIEAGDGILGFAGDGGPALKASLASPSGVAIDRDGALYIADTGNNRIRRIDLQSGTINTVAGNGKFGGPGGVPALNSGLDRPVALAFGPNGGLFIAESTFEEMRRVDPYTGIISTVAGFPTAGLGQDGSSMHSHSPSLAGIYGIAVDENDNIYVADARNNRICMLDDHAGVFSIIAGNAIPGFGGDNGMAPGASLVFPEGVALDRSGDIFIADTGNNRIRRIEANTGIITTVAGNGQSGFSGDGGPATQAELSGPTAVAVDTHGGLLVSDTGNNCIRRIAAKTGIITTLAGRNH